MVETPPSAHKSRPLKKILHRLNHPEERDEIDEDAMLADLAENWTDVDKTLAQILKNDDGLTTLKENNNVKESTFVASEGTVTNSAAGKKVPDELFSSLASKDEKIDWSADDSSNSDSRTDQSFQPTKKKHATPRNTTAIKKKMPPDKPDKPKKPPARKQGMRQWSTKKKHTTPTAKTTLMPAATQRTSIANNNNSKSPSANVPKATFVNALKMEEAGAFDAGYDTVGSLSPMRGTDPVELANLKEDAIAAEAPCKVVAIHMGFLS
jgi:hypothetical protein